jgi:hypothetical protein
MTLTDIESYFTERCDEIVSLAQRGDLWIFLCGSAMIDYLTNMVTGHSTRLKYIKFIEDYFSQINILYKEFQYKNGSKDLPTQMYVILRCGIVHSFSFVPNQQGLTNGGRTRSILLAHEKNGHSHFDTYRKSGMDSVVFTAEQFSKDIKSVVKHVFKTASSNQQLENKIINYVMSHPPILGQFS